MISRVPKLTDIIHFLSTSSKTCAFFHGSSEANASLALSDLDILVEKVKIGSSDEEVVESLANDLKCSRIQLTHQLFDILLHRFKDDWKSALGVFRWAESRSGYEHTSEAYDMVLDTLGKMKQMDKMVIILQEMRDNNLVTLNTVAKVMRRFAGAGQWEEAVRIFDELGTFGLEKSVESMNLLLDTLCKAHRVEQAREIFLKLKPHVLPNANTFNIFIHGWCKIGRVDEANWTIEEMKGHGCRPCIISYSTIIKFHCSHSNFDMVRYVLDEMRTKGCLPNVVTYTTIMSYMAKAQKYEDALEIAEMMKSDGLNPDTLFYNSLIHVLGRAGKVREAIRVFEVEMPKSSVSPNTSTYNTMIAMFCHCCQEEKASSVLERMEDSGMCKPDVQTYYPLLKSCFRTGQTDDLLSKLLDDMVKKHHLSLDLSAYTLLIHGLCRANKCDWAYLLFEEMTGQGIVPRYKTCRLLLEEVKQKHLYDAAEKIEDFMKKM